MRKLENGLFQEVGHEKVFDALSEAANKLYAELASTKNGNELIDELMKATWEYDKFIFKYYLKKLIEHL